MSGKTPITFRIYKGEELLRTEQLAQDIIKVGKLPSSHLRIDDDNVSRMHAVIEVTGPDEIFIIDLGSASGTMVNGKKVNKCKLATGDEITLGDTRVVVELGGAAAAVSPAAVSAAPPPPAPVAAPPPPVAAAAPPPPPAAPVPNPFAAPPGGLPNPFAPPPSAHAGHGGSVPPGDPDNVQYGIVASGPPILADEVETAAQAAEVVVMWGDRSVLHVEHLSPIRSFYIGEASTMKGANVDFVVGSDALGSDRMAVAVNTGSGIAAVIPAGATGEVSVQGQMKSIDELRSSGQLQPCPEVSGAMQYVVPAGATARVKFREFTFIVKAVQAGKKVAGGANFEMRPLLFIGGSLLVHSIFLLMFYFMPPSASGLSLDLLDENSRLVQYLMQPPETVEEELPEFLEEDAADESGGKGERHKGEEGQMGKQDSQKTKNKFGIEGPQDNPDPHMAREEALEQARTAGILGVLQSSVGAFNSPTSPFGRDSALGNDAMSALGALMGDQIGENFGFGGLGLRGTGRGGGGTGEGTIGLGNFGTIGHGAGGGSGSGYGRGAGNLGGRSARVPQIRAGTADVRGSLSREVIRRVVRRHINEVKFCYEQELNTRPDLTGRVTVAFIISPTGAVQAANVGATTMNNARVETCITGAVRRWTFPAPDGGGIVVVNYPFTLEPSG